MGKPEPNYHKKKLHSRPTLVCTTWEHLQCYSQYNRFDFRLNSFACQCYMYCIFISILSHYLHKAHVFSDIYWFSNLWALQCPLFLILCVSIFFCSQLMEFEHLLSCLCLTNCVIKKKSWQSRIELSYTSINNLSDLKWIGCYSEKSSYTSIYNLGHLRRNWLLWWIGAFNNHHAHWSIRQTSNCFKDFYKLSPLCVWSSNSSFLLLSPLWFLWTCSLKLKVGTRTILCPTLLQDMLNNPNV